MSHGHCALTQFNKDVDWDIQDLTEAMEQNYEKQQAGLAETARILDQKLEQTNAVVHEQLEQLVLKSLTQRTSQRVKWISVA